jgi:lipopolysaccharide export system protein LptC
MNGAPPAPAFGRGFVGKEQARRPLPEIMRSISGYRRRTFLLKALLPTIAIGTLVTVATWSSWSGSVPGFRMAPLTQASSAVSEDAMVNPRFYGVDDNNQPFTVTADMAMRDPSNDARVNLTMLQADMADEDDSWTYVSADKGLYDRDAETLDLEGSVSMFTGDGLEVKTDAAQIDLVTGTARGAAPLHGQGAWGMLDAVGFTYKRDGNVFNFFGKPTLVLYPVDGNE